MSEAELQKKVVEYEALIRDLTDALRAQRTWVGLTGGEVLDVLVSVDKETVRLPSMLGIFARAIEDKLKEKNT